MMSCAHDGWSIYVLTGSVSSSYSVVTPLLQLISPRCHELKLYEEHGISVFASNYSLVWTLVSLDPYKVTVSMSTTRQVSLL